MITKQYPEDKIIVVPDWVVATVNKRGHLSDILNFSKMRQWFNQEQLVAMSAFSRFGLNILSVPFSVNPTSSETMFHRSLGYAWYFPEDQGGSPNGSEADTHAKNAMSRLEENVQYVNEMVDTYVVEHLKDPATNKVDLSQSYSVYHVSEKMIVLSFNRGLLSPASIARKDELRLSILRSVLEKLYGLHEMHEVHKSVWFGQYLAALQRMK